MTAIHFCILLVGLKRELVALLDLSSWCLVMAERLFLAVPRGCLQFVIVVFPDHTHLLFLVYDSHRECFLNFTNVNMISVYLSECSCFKASLLNRLTGSHRA